MILFLTPFFFLTTILAQPQDFEVKGTESAEMYYRQANSFLDESDPESAATWLNRALDADSTHDKARFNLALVYCRLGNFSRAEIHLRKLLENYPEDLEALTLYGSVQSRSGNYQRAIAAFDAALRLQPGEALFTARAWAYAALGEAKLASHDFDEALRLNPASFAACMGKGVTLGQLGLYRQALGWLDKALEIKPEDITAISNRAIILFHSGEKEAAAAAFETALAAAANAPLLLARSQMLLESGDPNAALRDADQALSLDPKNPEGYLLRGKALVASGQLEEAIAEFYEALRLSPDWQEPKNSLLNAYRQMDERRIAEGG